MGESGLRSSEERGLNPTPVVRLLKVIDLGAAFTCEVEVAGIKFRRIQNLAGFFTGNEVPKGFDYPIWKRDNNDEPADGSDRGFLDLEATQKMELLLWRAEDRSKVELQLAKSRPSVMRVLDRKAKFGA